MGSGPSKGLSKREGWAKTISRSFAMSFMRPSENSHKLRATESFHVVSLTSSTYGVLQMDSPDNTKMYSPSGLRSMSDLSHLLSSSDLLSEEKPEMIDVWEIMDGVEEEQKNLVEALKRRKRGKNGTGIDRKPKDVAKETENGSIASSSSDLKELGFVHVKQDTDLSAEISISDNLDRNSNRVQAVYSDANRAGFSDANGGPVVLMNSGVAKKVRILASSLSGSKINQEKGPKPVKKYSSFEEKFLKASRLENYELRCPPGGENAVILYTTSLGGIRKTFSDCNRVRQVLKGHCVRINERDISMHKGFREELRNILGRSVTVPRLFIKGRYIGGADEIQLLNDDSILQELLVGLPKDTSTKACDCCDGMKFVPCKECSGSCKIFDDFGQFFRCPDCNENGLISCPMCL